MIKKLLAFAIFLLPLQCFGQLRSTVDERMELTGIVFKIAGIEEYVNNMPPQYSDAVDKWFEKYADHELFRFIKEMRQERGLALAGIAASAPYLVINDDGIHDSNIKSGSDIDGRWTDENWSKYVGLLDDFYHKSKFHDFFISQTEFYTTLMEQMDMHLENIDTTWFHSFFGSYEPPVVYASPCNGPNNYCFSDPTLSEDGYGISIGVSYDPKTSLLHEMCHRYTGFSTDYYPRVKDAMSRIFETGYVVRKFWDNHYGTGETVFNEWITNLAVAMYIKEHDNTQALRNFTAIQRIWKGYIWMPRAVEFMENFYVDRDQYRLFEDFMPRICEFMNYITMMDNWEKIVKEDHPSKPYITNIYPVDCSSLIEYSNIDAVRITFSEPMNTFAIGFNGLYPSENTPFNIYSAYWEDDRTLVIPLFKNVDIEDRVYRIILNKDMYQNSRTLECIEYDYQVTYLPRNDKTDKND